MVLSSGFFKFIYFSDATTLITNLNNEGTRDESLHFELANVHTWLKANKLSLNVNKTKAMVFHMPQKRIQLLCLKFPDQTLDLLIILISLP